MPGKILLYYELNYILHLPTPNNNKSLKKIFFLSVEILHKVMIFGDEACGRYLGLDEVMKVESFWWDLFPYKKRHQQTCIAALCHEKTQKESSHLEARKTALTRTQQYWHPDLRLSASKTVRKLIFVV